MSQVVNPDFIRWEKYGLSQNAVYMTIICDTFSFDYYPVYSKTIEECQKKEKEFAIKSMQKVIKSYKIGTNNDQEN